MARARRELLLGSLPADVLLLILHELVPRELCAMEAVSWMFRYLVDDRIWRSAFLQQRRGPVLREPHNYKNELISRDRFSKDWRKITGCPSEFKLSLAQRLRRMISLGSMPRQHDTLVVDPSGETGPFSTICAALAQAKPFDRVLVRPGVYSEALRLNDHVEIIGDGPAGSVVLCATDGPVIEAIGRVSCRLAHLVIKQHDGGHGGHMTSCIAIKSGASLVIEDSIISADLGHCIVIQGLGSCGHIVHNAVVHSKGVGILVREAARGVIEDNDIAASGRAGIAILGGGDPLVRQNRIRDGLDSGVLVSEQGRGVIEDNDICGNRRAGVAILKEGAPLVQRNRIHHGLDSGVLVCEQGEGSVVENEIFANEMAGVAVGRGGATCITGNTIKDGSGGSLCLSQHSKGAISSNIIHQHPRATMQVPADLISEVRNMNDIRYEAAAPAAARDYSC